LSAVKRRVTVTVFCLVLAALVIVAVRVTTQRFDNADTDDGPPSLGATVAPVKPAATEAAVMYGWQQADGDDFTGTKVNPAVWESYDGTNPISKERWSPKQCAVRDGLLTITGQADDYGSSCGIAWRADQTYGRWEVRARMPAPADAGFTPVFLLWGADDVNYPQSGEIDFGEEYDPARQYIESWLHGPGNTEGGYFKSKPVDLTQWHNFAVEWQPDHITIYLDGLAWGTYTDPKFIPRSPMHLVVQQNFNRKHPGPPLQSTVQVDWVRIYH
jgi:beta-glucanase (GH16 family)